MEKRTHEWLFQFRLAERALRNVDEAQEPERYAQLKARMEEAEQGLLDQGAETIRFMGQALLRYADALHEAFEHRESPDDVRRIVEKAFSRGEV